MILDPAGMPRPLYLLAILVSFCAMVLIDRRLRLGVLGRSLVVTIVVVEAIFLGFDLVATARGWYASGPSTVVAIVAPGIPPEEVLLLAFLATFTIVVLRLAERLLAARRSRGDGA